MTTTDATAGASAFDILAKQCAEQRREQAEFLDTERR